MSKSQMCCTCNLSVTDLQSKLDALIQYNIRESYKELMKKIKKLKKA